MLVPLENSKIALRTLHENWMRPTCSICDQMHAFDTKKQKCPDEMSPGIYRHAVKTSYQLPVLGMLNHGSTGASGSPSWSISKEMPSGDLMNAIYPSLGGRLIATPASMRF